LGFLYALSLIKSNGLFFFFSAFGLVPRNAVFRQKLIGLAYKSEVKIHANGKAQSTQTEKDMRARSVRAGWTG